jgi:hypothetical protein
MNEKLKDALILFAEIAGFLAVFVVFLLILNFFNLLSLSGMYPNQLGFLPRQQSNSTQGKPLLPSPTPINNNQSVPASFAKLQNQALDSQMKKYQTYAALLSNPTVQANPNDYVSDGVLSGYDARTIQVVIKRGVLNLSFDQNTLFQKQPAPQTQANGTAQSGTLPRAIAYTSPKDFFKNVSFGRVLQVYFSRPDLKATQVNYIESIKLVL